MDFFITLGDKEVHGNKEIHDDKEVHGEKELLKLSLEAQCEKLCEHSTNTLKKLTKYNN